MLSTASSTSPIAGHDCKHSVGDTAGAIRALVDLKYSGGRPTQRGQGNPRECEPEKVKTRVLSRVLRQESGPQPVPVVRGDRDRAQKARSGRAGHGARGGGGGQGAPWAHSATLAPGYLLGFPHNSSHTCRDNCLSTRSTEKTAVTLRPPRGSHLSTTQDTVAVVQLLSRIFLLFHSRWLLCLSVQ